MYLNENCASRNPESFTARDIARALDAERAGRGWIARCPAHDDRNASFSISDVNGKVLVHCFAGCTQGEVIEVLRARGLWPENDRTALPDPVQRKLAKARRAERADAADAKDSAARRETALWLWNKSLCAENTIVRSYLESRSIDLERLPSTLRFLPADSPKYPHPAMIAAFGLPDEPEPGALHLRRNCIRGVHLTYLRPDGSDKAETDPVKKMIGRSSGWPIVLQPPNDLGGLLIAEGIETALSASHLGLGLWAAGTAGRLPLLADKVPSYIETVTIAVDQDENGTGQRNAGILAELLEARGIEARLIGGAK